MFSFQLNLTTQNDDSINIYKRKQQQASHDKWQENFSPVSLGKQSRRAQMALGWKQKEAKLIFINSKPRERKPQYEKKNSVWAQVRLERFSRRRSRGEKRENGNNIDNLEIQPACGWTYQPNYITILMMYAECSTQK